MNKFLKYLWEAKFFILAIITLTVSGSAQGFILTALLGFAFLFLIIETFVSLILLIIKLLRKTKFGTLIRIVILDLIAVGIFMLASQIDKSMEQESFKNGDRLIQYIEEYKTKNGAYPINLDELPINAKGIKPALANSVFYYQKLKDGGYRLYFGSTAWMQCFREYKDKNWHCDD